MSISRWLKVLAHSTGKARQPRRFQRGSLGITRAIASSERLEARTLLAATITSPASATTYVGGYYNIAGTAPADALVRVYTDANNNGAINGADAVVGSQQLTGGATAFSITTALAQQVNNNFLVTTEVGSIESSPVDVPTIAVNTTQATGSGQAIDIRQAFATTNYAIALQGTFPSESLRAGDSDSNLSAGSDPVLGSIMQFAGNFAPAGWALCHGQILSINQNQSLYSILGTTFGGDGKTTFALPDLRGRVPVGIGSGPGLTPVSLGEKVGGFNESVTFNSGRVPVHDHTLSGGGSTNNTGANASFSNRMPALGLTPVIALQGLFPSRSLATPSIASISWFAGNYAPPGFAKLEGQLLSIAANSALFSLLGTTYGGDGETNFALPDLRGRTPIHQGSGAGLSNVTLGQKAGTETITLTEQTSPGHSHNILGQSATNPAGGGQAIDLRMPYLAVNYEIARFGVFPSESQIAETPSENEGSTGFISGDEVLDIDTANGLVQSIVAEGISRWTAAGISDEQIELLQSATYQIGDLDRGILAAVNGPNLVTIDADASNAGWFVDLTPDDDSEFGAVDQTTGVMLATDSAALYNYDLLTTIMHEQGHLLGLHHALDRASVMSGVLGVGSRLLPVSADLDFSDLSDEPEDHSQLLAGSDFLAQIGMFAGNFDVPGYSFTDGQLLAISQNSALFSLLGTIYGGDGETTFGLPDFKGRAVVGAGNGPGLSNYTLEQKGGTHLYNVTTANLPSHTHTLDNTAPTLTAFARNTPATSPTNADTLVFDITFSEDVQNVSADDFTVNGTTATGVLAGLGANYTLTVSGGDLADLDGTVSLDLAGSQDIRDFANLALPNSEPASDEAYDLDNTAPTVSSIVRADANPTNAATVDFTVAFNEAVSGVDIGDFVIDSTGVTGAEITGRSGSGTTYTVTVSTGTGAGTLGIKFDADAAGGVTDAVGNVSTADFNAGETYTMLSPDTEVTLNAGVLTITDINGGSSNDNLTISYSGGTYTLTDGGGLTIGTSIAGSTGSRTSTVTFPDTGINSIVFDALGGQDSLSIDLTSGNLSHRVTFNGGNPASGPGDSLTITGSGTFANATFSFASESAGSIDITGNQRITYTGLEPITSNITAIDVTLNYSNTGETITVSDAGGGRTTVDSDVAGETVTFKNPTGRLIVNPGSVGESSDDIITFNGLTAAYPASIGVYSLGGNDTINVDAAISTNGKDIFLRGENVNTTAMIDAGAGNITIAANSLFLGAAISGSNLLQIVPRSASTTVGLGNGATGMLNLDTTELSRIQDGFSSIAIGNASTGAVTANPSTFNDPLTLRTGAGGLINIDGTITGTAGDVSLVGGAIHNVPGAGIDAGTGSVTLDSTAAPGQSPGILNITGNLSLADSSTFEVEIGGTSPATTPANNEHDQIVTTGAVAIGTGVTLDLQQFNAFVPNAGDLFTIIDNGSGSAVNGTFNGLAEGATISNFIGSGADATITYSGGDGNDVVVRVLASTELNPVGDITEDPQPLITWQSTAGADRYEIWFSRVDLNPSQIYNDDQLSTASWTPPVDLPGGQYRYWVRAFDASGNAGAWSSGDTFIVSMTLTDPPPSFDLTPDFNWGSVPEAATYEIFLRQSGGDIHETGLTGASYTPASDLAEGPLYWWVRAVDSSGRKGAWSIRHDISVGGRSMITAPVGVAGSSTPQFDWQAITGAGRYILHVETLAGAVVIREDNVLTNSFTPGSPLASGNYRVWVKAINASDNTSGYWSAPVDFTITAVDEGSTKPTDSLLAVFDIQAWDQSATPDRVQAESATVRRTTQDERAEPATTLRVRDTHAVIERSSTHESEPEQVELLPDADFAAAATVFAEWPTDGYIQF